MKSTWVNLHGARSVVSPPIDCRVRPGHMAIVCMFGGGGFPSIANFLFPAIPRKEGILRSFTK